MARQFTRLRDIQFVPDTVGVIYPNGSGQKTFINGVALFNTNSTTETVKLYNVPNDGASAGTAGDGNQFDEVELLAKKSYIYQLPYPMTLLELNDTIQAVTTTASKVTIMLLGDVDS